jgi:hypothetical protein
MVRAVGSGETRKGEERQRRALPRSHQGGNDRKKGMALSAVRCSNRQTQLTGARGGGAGEGTPSTKFTALLARKPTAFVLVRRFLRVALCWQWGGSAKEVNAAVKPWEMARRVFLRWDEAGLPNAAARRAVCG